MYQVVIEEIDHRKDTGNIYEFLKFDIRHLKVSRDETRITISEILDFKEAQRLHDLLAHQLPNYRVKYEFMPSEAE